MAGWVGNCDTDVSRVVWTDEDLAAMLVWMDGELAAHAGADFETTEGSDR